MLIYSSILVVSYVLCFTMFILRICFFNIFYLYRDLSLITFEYNTNDYTSGVIALTFCCNCMIKCYYIKRIIYHHKIKDVQKYNKKSYYSEMLL